MLSCHQVICGYQELCVDGEEVVSAGVMVVCENAEEEELVNGGRDDVMAVGESFEGKEVKNGERVDVIGVCENAEGKEAMNGE